MYLQALILGLAEFQVGGRGGNAGDFKVMRAHCRTAEFLGQLFAAYLGV